MISQRVTYEIQVVYDFQSLLEHKKNVSRIYIVSNF